MIEASKKNLDLALLRESLRKTPEERLREFVLLQRSAQGLRAAGRRAFGG